MKIGLKIFPEDLHFIEKFSDIFDYFELFAEPNTNIAELKNYNSIAAIHAAHFRYGFNLGDVKKEALNEKLLNKAIAAADATNAKFIVVHPGHDNGKDSEEVMLKFLEKNFDKRLLFENCPAIDYYYTPSGHRYLFSTPQEMKSLLKKFNAGMCLDFSHAICTANILKKNREEVINDFLKLKPKYFHLSGMDIDAKADGHKDLYEVNNDFSFLKHVGKRMLTFETSYKTRESREAHLKNIKIVKSASAAAGGGGGISTLGARKIQLLI